MDYSDLERAYMETVIGSNPPGAIMCRGDLILAHRPDLQGEIDPREVYYITDKEIVLVEE
jgi:hypothetical protein